MNKGIFVWPASHLMCYYLLSLSHDKSLGETCELGCGVGLVGIAAVLSDCVESYSFTDGDPVALSICNENIQHNISQDIHSLDISTNLLLFGQEHDSGKKFDTVLGADIIYPSMSANTLLKLFQSVDKLLKSVSNGDDNEGTFLLSFVSRDGHVTPKKLIQAATESGFSIKFKANERTIFTKDFISAHNLMGSRVLKLERNENAARINSELGGIQCKVFPGLNDAIERAEEQSSDSDWIAPGLSDDDDSYF